MRVEAVEHLTVGHGDDRRLIGPRDSFEPADLGISDAEVSALTAAGKIRPVVTAPGIEVRSNRAARRPARSDLDEL